MIMCYCQAPVEPEHQTLKCLNAKGLRLDNKILGDPRTFYGILELSMESLNFLLNPRIAYESPKLSMKVQSMKF